MLKPLLAITSTERVRPSRCRNLASRRAPAIGRLRAESSCTLIGLTVSRAASTPEQSAEPNSTTNTSSTSSSRSELMANRCGRHRIEALRIDQLNCHPDQLRPAAV